MVFWVFRSNPAEGDSDMTRTTRHGHSHYEAIGWSPKGLVDVGIITVSPVMVRV